MTCLGPLIAIAVVLFIIWATREIILTVRPPQKKRTSSKLNVIVFFSLLGVFFILFFICLVLYVST